MIEPAPNHEPDPERVAHYRRFAGVGTRPVPTLQAIERARRDGDVDPADLDHLEGEGRAYDAAMAMYLAGLNGRRPHWLRDVSASSSRHLREHMEACHEMWAWLYAPIMEAR